MKVFPRPKQRSPLKRQPLRSPGQSVQQEMHRLLEDRMLPILLFAAMMGFVALYDWSVVLLHLTPRPYVSTTLFILGAGYATYKFFDVKRTIERSRWGGTGSGSSGSSWRTCGRTVLACFTIWSATA